jgi:integrase
MVQLTELRAKRIAPSDKPLADGTVKGLWLVPGSRKGQAKWILRFVSPVSGKRRDMGFGAYPEVGIVHAREAGNLARKAIARGQDPIDERQTEKAARACAANALTFEQSALRVHEELKAGWKNNKHSDQWLATLRQYAIVQIGRRKVADLGPQDFAHVLRPIWLTKPETATRVKQRCRTVMKWCWAHGMVASNPIDVVDHLLPQQPGKRVRTLHQPSMPWKDVPEFVQRTLRSGSPNVTRALLEFVILTAARSGEARAMTWGEVDLDIAIWTIPASRMKAKVTHRVPLSGRAGEILSAQRERHPHSDLVFPAPRGGVLSDMVLTKFLRDQGASSSEKGRVATAHGFRSSFRDWASESGYARDLAERALAHTIRNQAEAAYHRTDLLEQRRAMMGAWALFVNAHQIPDETQKSSRSELMDGAATA